MVYTIAEVIVKNKSGQLFFLRHMYIPLLLVAASLAETCLYRYRRVPRCRHIGPVCHIVDDALSGDDNFIMSSLSGNIKRIVWSRSRPKFGVGYTLAQLYTVSVQLQSGQTSASKYLNWYWPFMEHSHEHPRWRQSIFWNTLGYSGVIQSSGVGPVAFLIYSYLPGIFWDTGYIRV